MFEICWFQLQISASLECHSNPYTASRDILLTNTEPKEKNNIIHLQVIIRGQNTSWQNLNRTLSFIGPKIKTQFRSSVTELWIIFSQPEVSLKFYHCFVQGLCFAEPRGISNVFVIGACHRQVLWVCVCVCVSTRWVWLHVAVNSVLAQALVLPWKPQSMTRAPGMVCIWEPQPPEDTSWVLLGTSSSAHRPLSPLSWRSSWNFNCVLICSWLLKLQGLISRSIVIGNEDTSLNMLEWAPTVTGQFASLFVFELKHAASRTVLGLMVQSVYK